MSYKDLIDRSEAMKRLHAAAEKSRKEENGKACHGITIAMGILEGIITDNGWNDIEGTIPEGVMLNLEITEGNKQSVNRGWWDGEKFRNTTRIFSPEVVSGWQKIPMPRKEKICVTK